MWLRQEEHPAIKILLQYSTINTLGRECYEGEVQPYWKTDYKPMMMMGIVYNNVNCVHYK